ncbi:MAG: hypothetical protein EOS44_26170 [Mesorhizobium sp.]|nr:MAG: hypothetical protein EOS44_26170 [Mesorhizobium sp.]
MVLWVRSPRGGLPTCLSFERRRRPSSALRAPSPRERGEGRATALRDTTSSRWRAARGRGRESRRTAARVIRP